MSLSAAEAGVAGARFAFPLTISPYSMECLTYPLKESMICSIFHVQFLCYLQTKIRIKKDSCAKSANSRLRGSQGRAEVGRPLPDPPAGPLAACPLPRAAPAQDGRPEGPLKQRAACTQTGECAWQTSRLRVCRQSYRRGATAGLICTIP